jgi:hypothetical protein
MIEDKNVYYLGNQKLKKVNVPVSFTKRQLIEFSKCSNDPVYFTKKYIKIINPNKGLTSFNLWDFQEDMVSTFVNDRFTICKIPRQSGKTQTVVAVLLWYALFHENYSIAVLAHKSSQAREILSRLQFSYEHLPKWLQQGIVEWNKGNIILENGSKIEGSATSGNSIRGKTYNCVSGGSEITIKIGDIVGNISIGKLNTLMRNKNVFNNDDILWRNLDEFHKQQIYKYLLQNSREEKRESINQSTIKILTREGFKEFHGIKSVGIRKLIKIKLNNGYEIKCTKEHRILTNEGFIEAHYCIDKLISIKNNCFSGVSFIENCDDDFVYDILEVEDNNEFICNGINIHNCVYVDEFAFVPNNIQSEFFATVLPTISAGDETKMIITSTPNGMNMFHKIWTEAVAKKNTFTPIEVHWSQIPGRDEKWKEETIRNSSLIQFQQEYESISFNSTIYTNNGKISIGKLFNELRAYTK